MKSLKINKKEGSILHFMLKHINRKWTLKWFDLIINIIKIHLKYPKKMWVLIQ